MRGLNFGAKKEPLGARFMRKARGEKELVRGKIYNAKRARKSWTKSRWREVDQVGFWCVLGPSKTVF